MVVIALVLLTSCISCVSTDEFSALQRELTNKIETLEASNEAALKQIDSLEISNEVMQKEIDALEDAIAQMRKSIE